MDRLNYFSCYERLPSGHENQLTRAFLALLRLVPLAHAAFWELVRRQAPDLPSFAEIAASPFTLLTQQGFVPLETGRLVSVLVTDRPYAARDTIRVQRSARKAVYDGLACYEAGWILMIENKPNVENVGTHQFHPDAVLSEEIEIIERPAVVLWPSILTALNALLVSHQIRGTEAVLTEDFRQYVSEYYIDLQPYTNLAACGTSEPLLKNRCHALLNELGLGPAQQDRDDQAYLLVANGPAQRILLHPSRRQDGSLSIQLSLYPGMTKLQAESFYRDLRRAEFLALEHDGHWSVAPHLRLGFVKGHELMVLYGMLSPEAYLNYWMAPGRTYGRRHIQEQSEKTALFEELRREGLAAKLEQLEYDKQVTNTERLFVDLGPGFSVAYWWSLAEAVKLDSDKRMHAEIVDKVERAFMTWGQRLPPPENSRPVLSLQQLH